MLMLLLDYRESYHTVECDIGQLVFVVIYVFAISSFALDGYRCKSGPGDC